LFYCTIFQSELFNSIADSKKKVIYLKKKLNDISCQVRTIKCDKNNKNNNKNNNNNNNMEILKWLNNIFSNI